MFRALLVMEVALIATSRYAVDWSDSASRGYMEELAFWVIVAAVLAFFAGTNVALWFFVRTARLLYLASVLIYVGATVWFGAPRTTGVEAVVDYVASLCTGAILALMWFAPQVAERFRKQPNSTVERDGPEAARPSL
jgi:hypothetical protein